MDLARCPVELPRALRRLEDRNTRYVWVRQDAYLELLRSKRSSALCITAMDAAGEPLARSQIVLSGQRDQVTAYLRMTWPDLDGQELARVAQRISAE